MECGGAKCQCIPMARAPRVHLVHVPYGYALPELSIVRVRALVGTHIEENVVNRVAGNMLQDSCC